MLWETLHAWDDNFIDIIAEDKWNESVHLLEKHPDITLSVSSMFNAELDHPLSQKHMKEIREGLDPDIDDETINEEGYIRFVSEADYKYNSDEENVDTLREDLNKLDIDVM